MLMQVLGCPICGEIPHVSTDGSCIDIECCVSMSRQKCDYMTMEERETWSDITYRHSDESEKRVLELVISEWNTRSNIQE